MELTASNLVKWFQLKYPSIVSIMRNCSHHYEDGKILNPYHLEGDVFCHTMMVVLEAEKFKDTLNEDEYVNLLVAALLHDTGKTWVRKKDEEKQKVHFFGHEPLSAFLGMGILDHIKRDFNVDLNKRLIMEAIAMHTDVYNVNDEEMRKRLISNSELARLFYCLGICDHSGRFFEAGNTHITIPDRNSTGKRDVIIWGREVVVMVGLPCSGKSTLAKEMESKGYSILSRDDIVHELGALKGLASYDDCFDQVDQKEVDKVFNDRKKDLIKNSKNVVIDMTNMSRKSRRKNLSGFEKYNKKAIVIMSNLDSINFRNGLRIGKIIPDHVFEKMICSFKPPLYDEFDEIEWRFN